MRTLSDEDKATWKAISHDSRSFEDMEARKAKEAADKAGGGQALKTASPVEKATKEATRATKETTISESLFALKAKKAAREAAKATNPVFKTGWTKSSEKKDNKKNQGEREVYRTK